MIRTAFTFHLVVVFTLTLMAGCMSSNGAVQAVGGGAYANTIPTSSVALLATHRVIHHHKPPNGGPPRALWVWTTPTASTLVHFATANGIQILYYSTNVPGAAETTLIAAAHAAHIQILALNGDPAWGTAAGVGGATAWENGIISYNSAHPGATFDGISLDIEPAVLTGPEGIAFVSAMQTIRNNNLGIHLEMSQQDAFGTTAYAGYSSLAAALDATGFNEVEIMSYRHVAAGGNGMTDVGGPDLTAAHSAGIKAMLGAETNNVAPASITFYGMTYAAMQAVLSQTDSIEAGVPEYSGIAIEDYVGYSAIPGAPL